MENAKGYIVKMKLIVSSSFFLLLMCGCSSPDIQDQHLNDRVKACSAGFSESTCLGLHASLNRAALQGGINSDIREETKSMIFNEIPDGDKLKCYEDYINCVESNWNNG